MSDISVELQEHTAMQTTALGTFPVAFNQYKVFVNGNLAGYVGKGEGQSVKLIAVGVPQQIKDQISLKVAEFLGTSAQPLVEPPRIPDETEQVEEDDSVFDEEF